MLSTAVSEKKPRFRRDMDESERERLAAWQTISSDGLSAKMQPVNLSRKRFSVLV